jgi:hypothetical protein
MGKNGSESVGAAYLFGNPSKDPDAPEKWDGITTISSK